MANDYEQRVHRVMDHIRRNLADELTLETQAKVACFSPYHFHRIFKSVTKETVAAFTRRARLERAVYLMRGAPDRTLSSVALEVGFNTPSDFSRVFRSHFGLSPSSWDRRSRLDGGQDFTADIGQSQRSLPAARVVEHRAATYAYVRVRDPWRQDNLSAGYASLTEWLQKGGVDWRARPLIGLSWDSELATPLEKLVYDLAIASDPTVEATGQFGIHELPAVKAVEIHCNSLPEIALAWEYLYNEWLPASGYEPDDLPAIKRFRATPEVFDRQSWVVDCSIALRPARP